MALWSLVQALLLAANGVAVLDEERFLDRHGLGYASLLADPGAHKTLKGQLVSGIAAVQYLRVPLIALNSVVIVVKLLFS